MMAGNGEFSQNYGLGLYLEISPTRNGIPQRCDMLPMGQISENQNKTVPSNKIGHLLDCMLNTDDGLACSTQQSVISATYNIPKFFHTLNVESNLK